MKRLDPERSTMTTEAEVEKPQQSDSVDLTNPVLGTYPGQISWEQWLERLKQAGDTDGTQALLHYGFNIRLRSTRLREREVPEPDFRAERVIMYLRYANGWTARENFLKRDALQSEAASSAQVVERHLISQKAMKILCSRFFKDTEEDKYYHEQSWMSTLELPGILEAIFAFFAPDSYGNLRNADGGRDLPETKIIRQFLTEFWLLSWKYGRRKYDGRSCWRSLSEAEEQFKAKLIAYRPRALIIGRALGQIDTLLDRQFRPDLETLKVLDRMAHTDGQGKPYESIDAALVAYNQAASVFHQLSAMIPEEARQKQAADKANADRIEAARLAREAIDLTAQNTARRANLQKLYGDSEVAGLGPQRSLEDKAAGINTMPAV